MDSKRHSPISSSPTRTLSRSPSIDRATSNINAGEHAESPMRKRPRLGSKAAGSKTDATLQRCVLDLVEDNTGSATLRSSNPPQADTPATESGRVTLNIRSAQVPPESNGETSGPPEKTSVDDDETENEGEDEDNAERRNEGAIQDGEGEEVNEEVEDIASDPSVIFHEALDFTAQSPQSPQSPPVVDIEVDDLEDVAEETYSLANSGIRSADGSDQNVLKQFPFDDDNDMQGAANAVVAVLSGKDPVDPAILLQIGAWLEHWLTLSHDDPLQAQQSYMTNRPFWDSIASIYSKMINRKSNVGPGFLRHDQATRRRILDAFFQPYFALAQDILRNDIINLNGVSSDAHSPFEMLSLRHLKNLLSIFRLHSEETPLWKMMGYLLLDFDDLQYGWVVNIIEDPLQLQFTLVDAISSLSASQHTHPSHNQALALSGQCYQSIISLLSSNRQSLSSDHAVPRIRHLLAEAFHVAVNLEKYLQADFEKQSGALLVDVVITLSRAVADLLQSAASMNPGAVRKHYPEISKHLVDLSRTDAVRMQHDLIYLQLLWRCVEKGRMELRVQALILMSSVLVMLWKNYNSESEKFELVLHAASHWLEEQQVLEYLIGVESHPQLITRSQDILGFLIVTKCWTGRMTDCFWSAVVAQQDRRIAVAAVEMLTGILNLADPSQLFDFCKKLYHLPVHDWGPEVGPFMNFLIDKHSWAQFPEGEYTANGLCVHVLQQTASSAASSDSDMFKLHELTYNLLERQSTRSRSLTERNRLYSSCLEKVKARTTQSLGSVESILALSSAHEVGDISMIAEEGAILASIAEEVCLVVARHNDTSEERNLSPRSLGPYLKFFVLLVTAANRPTLSEDLEKTLFDHLIGPQASSDMMRNEAWQFLLEIVNITKMKGGRNMFLDRLIEGYLPCLRSDMFTMGLLRFIDAVSHYVRRPPHPTTDLEESVVNIPLADLLWRIILDASSDAISEHCMSLFSRNHLDAFAVDNAPLACVKATHVHLVNQCIMELQRGTHTKSACTDTSTGSLQSTAAGDQLVPPRLPELVMDCGRRFKRTLRFLQKFLLDTKERPAFLQIDSTTSSPISKPGSRSVEELTIEVKYQAFSQGRQFGIRQLTLPKSSTSGDLTQHLREATGFSEIAIISGGRQLDLLKDESKPITDMVNRGLLIVRNVSKAVSVGLRSSKAQTAAEKAVLTHFDTFYGFLDLAEDMSKPVYDFMNDFPPHARVYEMVMQDTPLFEQVLPTKHHCRMRTMYSIRSMKRHFSGQLASGCVDEKYLSYGTRLLTRAFSNEDFCSRYLGSLPDPEVALLLSDCLLSFLKERPVETQTFAYIIGEQSLVHRLCSLLRSAMLQPESALSMHCWIFYATIQEASFHSQEVWNAFKAEKNTAELLYGLLVCNPHEDCRDHVKACIETACSTTSPSIVVSIQDFGEFFWSVLYTLIANVTGDHAPAKQLLGAATAVFSSYRSAVTVPDELQSYMESWTTILSRHTYVPCLDKDGLDEFVFGMVRLLSTCITYLRSYKKPIANSQLLRLLVDKLLFVPLPVEAAEALLPKDTAVLDESTRKELYSLSFTMIDTIESFSWLIDHLTGIISQEAKDDWSPWNTDRTRWLRTRPGYAGLRNLTNTCYMNSLVTQLFMNSAFRGLMLNEALLSSESGTDRRLLRETQVLFANMQNGTYKYADTTSFAKSVKPYDSDHIDVTVQMDVDEFYNLLFDRWEAQMPSEQLKERFRSYYGGQLVTQIKSLDCDHVSERLEPFLAIQCEVKGKTCLTESLKAYIEGDAMEGDNKYKCEACGGRLVNALKRSCLSNLPDDLIFHLKRFDFDLATLQRSKINDEFKFPTEIDMTPYHVDHLRDPDHNSTPDMYDLQGILVHNGTAESGHYYSYIRLPSVNGATGCWAEFNDIEVTEFDPNRIPDQCFGGFWSASAGDQQFAKSYNAYMLFYRRRGHVDTLKAVAQAQDSSNQNAVSIVPELAQDIATSNALLTRRYCLYGVAHAQFIRSLASTLKNLQGANCSEDHHLEGRTIGVMLDHLTRVFAKVKDFPDYEVTIQTLKRMSSSCGSCAASMLDWITTRPDVTCIMLLQCPNSKIRTLWAALISSLLQNLRRHDSHLEEPNDSDSGDALNGSATLDHAQSAVHLLATLFPVLWNYGRGWDDYFGLWHSIAERGHAELRLILDEGIFCDALDLLLFDRERRSVNVLQCPRNIENKHHLAKLKRLPSYAGLVRFLHTVLSKLDLSAPDFKGSSLLHHQVQIETQRYAPNEDEWQAMNYFDKGTKQMPFIVRLMDAMESEFTASAWYPGEIISLLLNENCDFVMVEQLSQTLCTALKDWLPAYSGFVLRSASYFCLHCPLEDEIVSVVHAAASNTAQMIENLEIKHNPFGQAYEFSSQGGQYHLDFYRNLAYAERPDLEDVLCPLRQLVLRRVSQWAPPLLLYDTSSVRDLAADLFHGLLFDHFSEDLDDLHELDEESQEPTFNTKVVRLLFDKLFGNIAQAERQRMPKAVVKATLDTMDQCANWLFKLRAQNAVGESKAADDARMIRRYQDVRRQVEKWREEDGDGFSETEWASNFDDASSDELTEV